MSNSIPSEVYPFATQDGKAIPLDIIKPAGLILQAFTPLAVASFIIPAGYKVGTMLASKACIVRFGQTIPALVDGTFYEDMLLIPNDTIITVSFDPTTLYVEGLTESGTFYLQLIERWAGLALDKQFSKK